MQLVECAGFVNGADVATGAQGHEALTDSAEETPASLPESQWSFIFQGLQSLERRLGAAFGQRRFARL